MTHELETFKFAYDTRLALRETLSPYWDDGYKLYRAAEELMRESVAELGHTARGCGEYMSDWVECSCGWKSASYWDGMDLAYDDYWEHVHEALGFAPKTCPCGKKYVLAEGGKPCHELVPT